MHMHIILGLHLSRQQTVQEVQGRSLSPLASCIGVFPPVSSLSLRRVLRNGQIGVIDESFEKEVWYVGQVPALYLTIDVWHPDLSIERQRQIQAL
jgi:hypothetical protein